MTTHNSFDVNSYWETRLNTHPDLIGTGHRRFSLAYNEMMYQVATERIRSILAETQIDLVGSRILDIGSGFGYFIQKYIEWGARQVTGVDITQVSVQYLQQKFPKQEFTRADIAAEDLDLPGTYDLVSAISVIFHILDDTKFVHAIDNISKRVQPGGHLLVVDSFRDPILPSASHAKLRGLKHYKPILDKYDFRIIAIKPLYFVMGRTFVPVIGPKLLGSILGIKILSSLEHWLERRLSSNFGGLKILIAKRGPTI